MSRARLLTASLLVATACGGNKTGSAPVITSFTAAPASITAGQSATLSWAVTGADTLTLDPGAATVTGTSSTVSPTSTTTYTLTAKNATGSVTANAVVTVTGTGNDAGTNDAGDADSGQPGTDAGADAGRTDAGTAGAPTTLTKVSGDGQTGAAGSSLTLPLKVRVTDANANPVPGVTITWAAASGGGSVGSATSVTAADGTASSTAQLGASVGAQTFTATSGTLTGSPALFSATATAAGPGLVYTDPPAGGKIRLVKNAASTSSSVVLDLVAAQALSGFSVGFNLPVSPNKVVLNATPLVAGSALPAGTAPVAAKAVLPGSGPLKGVLVSGQTQKAAGTGAVPTDSAVTAGQVFYTLHLDIAPGATVGTVFDGAALPPGFKGALRNLLGANAAVSADFAIGKLEVR